MFAEINYIYHYKKDYRRRTRKSQVKTGKRWECNLLKNEKQIAVYGHSSGICA